MKRKKLMSLVLVFTMLFSILPSFGVSAEDAHTLSYEFKTSVFSNAPTTLTAAIGEKTVYGTPYTPLRYTKANSTVIGNNIKYVTMSANKGAMLFAIEIDEPGTYIPSIKYYAAKRGSYLKTYFVKDASLLTNGNTASGEDDALLSDISNITPLDSMYIDTYASADDLEKAIEHEFSEKITVDEAGTYYLVLAADGSRPDANTKAGKTMLYIEGFNLTKEENGGLGDGDDSVSASNNLTYNFNSSALGANEALTSGAVDAMIAHGQATGTNTAKWTALRMSSLNSSQLTDASLKVVSPNGNKTAVLFAIEIDKAGEYTPSVVYDKAARGGHLEIYLFDKAKADGIELDVSALATKDTGLFAKITENLSPIDESYINTYGDTEEKSHTYNNKFAVSKAGTYYLAFVMNGSSANNAKSMYFVKSFNLFKEGEESEEEMGDISNAKDVIIKFDEPTCEPTEVTLEEYGWCINTSKSHSSATNATITSGNGLYSKTKYNKTGRLKLAIDVYVPNDGIYQSKLFSSYSGSNARLANVYCDDIYLGKHDYGSAGIQFSTFRSLYLKKGIHTFYFESLTPGKNNKYYHTLYQLCLIAQPSLPYPVEIETEKISYNISANYTVKLNSKVLMSDNVYYCGEKMFAGNDDPIIDIKYISGDENVVEVSEDGTVLAVGNGETTVTVSASANNITVIKDIPFVVSDEGESNILSSLEISAPSFVISKNTEGIQLEVIGKNQSGTVDVDISNAEVIWSSNNEDIVTVDENGFVKPVSLGSAEISVNVILGDIHLTQTAFVSVREGKIGRSFYTDERIEAARENISKYSWAKSEKDLAVKNAEKYLGLEDVLWNIVPSQDIPRSNSVGYKTDPDMHYCRYCGAYLYDKYGRYGYSANPLSMPWKIQCRECKRQFPSNNFAKYYELGIGENGVFSRELALEKNNELVASGENGYLVNVLYPELYDPTKTSFNKDPRTGDVVDGKTWGVDDGMGYDTGRVYESSGIAEVHTYIAYYNHVGLWYSNGATAPLIYDALDSLSMAYIYTGEQKYGRVGAILLDRIADFYPSYSIIPYLTSSNNKGSNGIFYVSSGGNTAGKIVGSIWENFIADKLSLAYDAFFPAYDDPYVVEFLSEKAQDYNFENDKSTPELIRDNCEDGLLREIFKGANDAQIKGNFGFVQATVATTAIVLDTFPETQEMIDWIFAQSKTDGETYNTGGGVNTQLVEYVSRDGQGNESAPGYNKIWITDLSDAASKLAGYDKYQGTNLYEHPKYLRMIKSYPELTLVRRGVAPIGDSSSAANYSKLPNDDAVMINAFAKTGDIEIAQHFYKMSDADFSTIHYDIFTKNPESLQADIEAVIKEHGEYNYDKSSMLTGYGFGALREGTLYDSTGVNVVRDIQRDFWMYFGGAVSHSNFDKLNLGIEAYGIPFTTDLGYPEATGTNPNKHQWANTTLAHNAVVVNEKSQMQYDFNMKPLHFDAKETRVKVMDIDASPVYIETDEYRRTIVMVDYDSEISYGIDFFKVSGGDDHIYSFHASSEENPLVSDNLTFVHQEEGTYAGADVPFGNDPWTNENSADVPLKYPKGYTWLYDIHKAENPNESEFWLDFKIKDFRNFSRNGKQDLHLRTTVLNDFAPDEVTLANGKPPRTANNLSVMDHLEYMLIRRKGDDLSSLFTTVFEPYNTKRYIKSIESVEVKIDETSEIQPSENDSVKAIKVELADGRCDYIVYAQNNKVTYNIGDVFKFRGFVGVWTLNSDGVNIYNYVNDGEMIGTDEKLITDLDSEISGSVVDFQRELSFDNWIEVELDCEIDEADAAMMIDRLVNIQNPTKLGNSSFVIKNVSLKTPTRVVVDIGEVTLIDGFANPDDESLGYSYDAAVGRKISIPMSYEENNLPIFDSVSGDITTSAGSTVNVKVQATAEEGDVSYIARTLPRGASFDEEKAIVTWKPSSSQIGDGLFAIDAIDELGRRNTIYFTVKVYGSTTGGGAGGGGGTSSQPDNKPTIPATKPKEKPESSVTPEIPSTPATPETDKNVRFVDLGNHAWAESAINALADEGIIKGTSENTFSPASNITRADFAILLVRAFKLASESTENFADVSNSDYFAKELAVARNTGLVNGIGENKFAPRNNIIRQDMIVIVYRALVAMEKKFDTAAISASDFANVSDYAKDAVSALVNAKLVNGKNGLIAPTDYTTRAEVAVLVKRILEFLK